MKRTIISLFYTTFLIFALFSSFNSFAGNDKVIRIMGDDNYPPFEYINDKGEPDGFNIDLIKTIMRDLGLNYTIELADWRIVLDSLKSNKVD